MPLQEAVTLYLGYLKARNLSLLSVETVAQHLRALLRGLTDWPSYPDLVRWTTTQDVGTTTMHHRIGAIKQFFAWAVDMGFIAENPATKLIKPKRPKKLPTVLGDDELKMLLDWTPTYEREADAKLVYRDRALVRIFMYTGLRRAEVCALNVADVSLATRTIAVHGGKGERDRTIVYHPDLDLEPLVTGRRINDPLFYGAYKRRRLKPDAITYMFKRKLSALVGRRVTPHMLRHSYATFMSRRGVPLRQIQQLLGHSSLATTQMYLAVTAQDLESAVGVFGELAESA